MIEFYRDLLIIICLGLLSWGVIRIERIYQYPFFMGSIFTSFILPQALSLINNSGPVSPEALERVLLMSCLCTAACWIGYKIKPNKRWLALLNIPIDERKLFRAGIALTAQGYLFNFLIERTPVQRASNGNFTGPATIYIFFSQVIYIAFAIFILQTLKQPKIYNIICTAIAGVPIVQTILIGRRTPTMTFLIILGLSLWLVRRYTPPRWLVITATLLMTFIIPVLGQLRGNFWNLAFSGNWQEILSATQNSFETQQKGGILELRNAALLMDGAEQTNIYGYGTGFWDSIIFQYVPGQIVGFDFKKSLQFNWNTLDKLGELYSYKFPNGTTFTGIGDSFMEFSYFGCIIFFLIARIFKNLWISSFYHQSTVSILLYMGLVSPAMVGITHGIGTFLQQAIFQVIFVSLVAYYSKAKQGFSMKPNSENYRV